ncbi:MAG: DoxX family protein [Chitinophagaceae bacterium]|nr:DoxX family protein [Chitinophagaceae bacterium]
MKKINIAYWVFTGLFLAVMIMSAVTSFMPNPDADAFVKHLGVPGSIFKFLAVLKVLGAIALLIPGYPRLKEWAYAGFTFDLVGAVYLGLAAGDPLKDWIFVFVMLGLVFASYYFYHKRRAGVVAGNASLESRRIPNQ